MIKQEPIDASDKEDSFHGNTQSFANGLDLQHVSVKKEPVEDGDQNVTTAVVSKGVIMSNSFQSVCQKACLQAPVRTSLISSNSQTFLVTSPPTGVQRLAGPRMTATGPAASISLLTSNLGLVPTVNGVITNGKPAQIMGKAAVQVTGPRPLVVSPVKGATLSNMASPNKAVLTNAVKLHGSEQQNIKPATQNLNSNIVFLKCVDNQGKTILIPQQLCSGVQTPTDKSTSVPKARSQPVIPVLNFSTSVPANFVSPPRVNPSIVTQGKVAVSKTVPESSKRVQSLLLRPENCTASPVANVIIHNDKNVVVGSPGKPGASVKLVSGFVPNQSVTNMKNGNLTVQRNQLKVTSQGLIQVQNGGDKIHDIKAAQEGCIVKPVVNTSLTLQAQPQVIVQSNVNKVVKGKSLLTNLTFSSCEKNSVALSQPASVVAIAGLTRPAAVTSTVPVKISTETVTRQPRQTRPTNHFVIVPVTTHQTSLTNTKLVNSANPTVTNNLSSGKLLLDVKSPDNNKMLIVVQNDLSKSSCVSLATLPTSSHVNSKCPPSLLIAKPQPTVVTPVTTVTTGETALSVLSSSNDQKKKKRVILMQDKSLSDMKPPLPMDKEKKTIVVDKKKKNKLPATVAVIKPLW